MLLSQRPPSANWEPLPLDPMAQNVVWVWFRPAVVPYGLMFVIPPTIFADPSIALRLTVRQLVAATGLLEERILGWGLNGLSFDADRGKSPLLDQMLPMPTGGNLELSIWIEPVHQFIDVAIPAGFPVPHQASLAPIGGANDADVRLLDAIESCWNNIAQMEVRIASIRKELASNISRLNSLNRDLNSDERRTCDSKDISAWADARRWLRDSISTLSRSVKEIDVGTTSGAGQRHKFEEIYRKQVVPRIPFAGLAQTVNEFDAHHKRVQTVLASAQANISRAGRDAEQRANAVLTRIIAKMRSIRRKD
jgi:hypothetical protein